MIYIDLYEFGVSSLVFWVSGLVFWMLDLYFGCVVLYFQDWPPLVSSALAPYCVFTFGPILYFQLWPRTVLFFKADWGHISMFFQLPCKVIGWSGHVTLPTLGYGVGVVAYIEKLIKLRTFEPSPPKKNQKI